MRNLIPLFEMPEFNNHSRSPGWRPLKDLFLREAPRFIAAHRDERFTEKHLIGARMWSWLLGQGLVDADLLAHAEAIHFRPNKEKNGLPLWRLAFKDTLRNTAEIDALFVGKRIGPTPRYARLAAAGLVPKEPARFVPEPAPVEPAAVEPVSIEPTSVEPAAVPGAVERYRALNEHPIHDDGSEWVYVYTVKRELDNHEQHGIAPMVKVGQTRNHYSARIANQVRQTASMSPHVCVHAYRVRDAQALEAAVHKALKVQGRHVPDAEGIEWFEAPPDHVHRLVLSIAGSP